MILAVEMNAALMLALARRGILYANLPRFCRSEFGGKRGKVSRLANVERLDTGRQYCSSSTVGLANWMVINGTEADKYLCVQACQGRGRDGEGVREAERARNEGRERKKDGAPFLRGDS